MSVIYGSPITLGGGKEGSASFELVQTIEFDTSTSGDETGELKLDLYSDGKLCYLVSASSFASIPLKGSYTTKISKEGIKSEYLPKNIEKYGEYKGAFLGKLMSSSPSPAIDMENLAMYWVYITTEKVEVVFSISTAKDYTGSMRQVYITPGTILLTWPVGSL